MTSALQCPDCRADYAPFAAQCQCGRMLEAAAPEAYDLTDFPPLHCDGPPPPPRLCLRVEGEHAVKVDGQRTHHVVVGERPLLIGRQDAIAGVYPDVDLGAVPGCDYVSRRHARVQCDDGRVLVTDLQGRGMTAIGDVSRALGKDQPTELALGERLIVGETIVFRLFDADQADPAQAGANPAAVEPPA